MKKTRLEAHEFYRTTLQAAEKISPAEVRAVMAEIGRNDLFYLLHYILKRVDIDDDWLYDRCREVQLNPNGYLDLWAREHYKSTIITFALTIQDVLNDPEITIGIFSITRTASKKFLTQIKEELESNETLKELYPDVLFKDPEKQSSRWSLEFGLLVKRKSNPKESTIEAYGLVKGLPTNRHFKIRIYDDVIDEENVTNPEMIKKSIKAWELSLNLGSIQPCAHYDGVDLERTIGTRYHINDPYKEIIKREAAIPRIYPGTENGEPDGKPVFWTPELMAKKRRKMGSYIFGCQILQNPTADMVHGFKAEWIQYWTPKNWLEFNRYLLCDPAGEKKKENDYTVMLVIGLGADQNYYLIDGLRDRLNLTERARAYIRLHRMYSPTNSGYEKYGKDSDIEHIEYVMEQENYRFYIQELGGPMPKNDRIRKLVPIAEAGRLYIPVQCPYIDYEKRQHNLSVELINDELIDFPVASHDDILDCFARVLDPDLGAEFPETLLEEDMYLQHGTKIAETEYNMLGD